MYTVESIHILLNNDENFLLVSISNLRLLAHVQSLLVVATNLYVLYISIYATTQFITFAIKYCHYSNVYFTSLPTFIIKIPKSKL